MDSLIKIMLISFLMLNQKTAFSDDALSPPLGMASKEFHRALRSEARQVSFNFNGRIEDIERMVAHLHNIKVSQINHLEDLEDLMDFSDSIKQFIYELRANNIDEDTFKRCQAAEMKVKIFDDRLGARLEELGRSETRIKSSS